VSFQCAVENRLLNIVKHVQKKTKWKSSQLEEVQKGVLWITVQCHHSVHSTHYTAGRENDPVGLCEISVVVPAN